MLTKCKLFQQWNEFHSILLINCIANSYSHRHTKPWAGLFFSKYSQIWIKRSPLGQRNKWSSKTGSIHMKFSMTGRENMNTTTNVVSLKTAQARCTRCNIMWSSLSVTCDRSVVFSEFSSFFHQQNWPPRYNWNIVENLKVTLNTIILIHEYMSTLIIQSVAWTHFLLSYFPLYIKWWNTEWLWSNVRIKNHIVSYTMYVVKSTQMGIPCFFWTNKTHYLSEERDGNQFLMFESV